MTLAAQDLSPLPERQGDDLAVAVAREVDLRTDRLGDEAGCAKSRPMRSHHPASHLDRVAELANFGSG